jgi:hypothetical protein
MPSLRLVDRSAVTREKPPHTFSLFNLTDGAGAALLPSVHPHFCFNHSRGGSLRPENRRKPGRRQSLQLV